MTVKQDENCHYVHHKTYTRTNCKHFCLELHTRSLSRFLLRCRSCVHIKKRYSPFRAVSNRHSTTSARARFPRKTFYERSTHRGDTRTIKRTRHARSVYRRLCNNRSMKLKYMHSPRRARCNSVKR